ncbi:unnamed protein product [Blepharisma stoltei]|uniref:protein-serine/threonine phosphatase n=1 Tax=Blepharisma stoltei TaxID=1481888 RepID=A0AAU9JD37_9CILI|nr:unnamed protein product [Blepharisma stoltei]
MSTVALPELRHSRSLRKLPDQEIRLRRTPRLLTLPSNCPSPKNPNILTPTPSLHFIDNQLLPSRAQHHKNALKESLPKPFSISQEHRAKLSTNSYGVSKAYAVITHPGLVRNYNEDRACISINMLKKQSNSDKSLPKCSYFSIFDGHGGSSCADFLRNNLHQYIIQEESFPSNPKQAIEKACSKAEQEFMKRAQGEVVDSSGSCCIFALFVGDMCYVANVGDSRAILSCERGSKVKALSRDHKPSDEVEKCRIIDAGGSLYQTPFGYNKFGPVRVNPGRLSVSRTFGDIEAKIPSMGGIPNVISSVPEIMSFKITDEYDFIILGSDGIFDQLTNKEIITQAWRADCWESENIHHRCGAAVESIIQLAFERRATDNLTTMMIALKGFKKAAKSRLRHRITPVV